MNMLNNMVSTSSTLPTHTDRVPAVCIEAIRSDPLHGLSTVTSYYLHFTDFYFFFFACHFKCFVCVCVCETELYLGVVWGPGARVWGDWRLAAALRSISQAELQAALVPGW